MTRENSIMPRSCRWVAITVASTMLALPSGRADDKLGANPMAPLERFVGGQWVVDGKWANGEALHARTIYEWGLGKKIIRAKTFVKSEGAEYQRYEGILTWHPKKKCLVEISFAVDGALTEYVLETKDADTLDIGWRPYDDGEPNKVRQTLKFKDRDSFVWTVWLNTGEKWQQLIEATWHRKKI
jgi:hypothetical protein